VQGQTQDIITFISSDNPADLAVPDGYTSSAWNPLVENNGYQTVYQTVRAANGQVVDTYQVASDVPEIDSAAGTGAVALLLGTLALLAERRRRFPRGTAA